jgi:hypothetical protein
MSAEKRIIKPYQCESGVDGVISVSANGGEKMSISKTQLAMAAAAIMAKMAQREL